MDPTATVLSDTRRRARHDGGGVVVIVVGSIVVGTALSLVGGTMASSAATGDSSIGVGVTVLPPPYFDSAAAVATFRCLLQLPARCTFSDCIRKLAVSWRGSTFVLLRCYDVFWSLSASLGGVGSVSSSASCYVLVQLSVGMLEL